jgi:hypothetical protein
VRIGSKVRVPLRRGKALVPEKRLHVVERDAVLHQPGRGRVPHDPRREPADLVPGVVAELQAALPRPAVIALGWRELPAQARGLYGRVPDAVADVAVIDRAATRRGEYKRLPGAAGASLRKPSGAAGPPRTRSCWPLAAGVPAR